MEITAGFTWGDGAHEHQLARPLMDVRPWKRQPQWMLTTLAQTVVTANTGHPVNEIEGVIRFEAEPAQLLAMLLERRGAEITYYEVRGGVRHEFPCLLVSVSPGGPDEVGLEPDPQRFSHGEYTATVRLRRIDGGDWHPVIPRQ